MGEWILYGLVRAVVALLQALPLRAVARVGRWGGTCAWWLDARHRRVALRNLTMVFGAEQSPAQIRALAREHFRRLGENYCCAVKTAAMTPDELRAHLQFVGTEILRSPVPGQPPPSRVIALGHFGNFELYARFGQFAPEFQCLTTYRALRQPRLNRLLMSLRERSGCRFFERRTEAAALRRAMRPTGVLLGLLADQRAGGRGLAVPLFGRNCSTSPAPALFALRYRCPLHVAVCYRTAPARWTIELGPEIPTRVHGRPRPLTDILRDMHAQFEAAIRRDPANWFWVHDRWKHPGRPERIRTGTLAAAP
jgi:KDO2-lipid IV(A) lauroyltransferase